ncbi:hypothetical protein K438DRAFT_1952348 [Mycena galopus ATCC 62051]|nr:hypothetical protein K438DRAFT_1952348 [Mycena galopus ATCC 62051]
MESPLVSEIEAFIDTAFDYIINKFLRLSEDLNIKMGILEAGVLLENDPLFDIPREVNNGNAKYDWVPGTSPQPGAAGRSMPLIRGKVLVDCKTGKRVTANSAYYAPASSRANLKLLTCAHACGSTHLAL